MKKLKTYKQLVENKSNELSEWKYAIRYNQIKKIKKLINNGFNINILFSINYFKNINSLVYALYYENYEIIKILIKNGINLDIQDPSTQSSFLSHLIMKSYIKSQKKIYFDLIKLLLDNGADVNIIDDDNEKNTPILNAVKYFNYDIIYLLTDYNADWSIKNRYNEDIFYMVSESVKNKLIEKYPDKYEIYLRKKNLDKFNI